jgi:glycogen debranching enzyme
VTAGPTDPLLRRCVRAALTNVLEVNTVPGQGPDQPGGWLHAGAGYAEPWTRDAAINSWLAASWLSPDVAAATLRAVCEDGPDGPVIAQDDQWWDQVIWVAAAYRHYLLTGDREWLAWADGVARRSLALARRGRYDEAFGLFRGPAVMADGVSAYPAELLEPGNESSFVLDHPRTHDVFSLSTNLVHAAAYAAAGRMSEALGSDGGPDRARTRALVEAVERRLRHGDGYGYLLVPDGSRPDGARLVLAQETLGLALALLGGLVEGPRAHRLVAGVHREPFGVVAVWPHLQEFTAEHPGRHNAVVWPWITGVWVQAVARAGDLAAFGAELGSYLGLIEAADFAYPEVQNARTGLPDGGWQTDAGWPGSSVPGVGRAWASEPAQTWSATALLGVVLESLLGLEPRADGMRIAPRLPHGLDRVRLGGIRYGAVALDVEVTGHGDHLATLTVDGVAADPGAAVLPTALRDEPAGSDRPRTVRVHAVVA